jgi:membrane associated rhomboid family serine protease
MHVAENTPLMKSWLLERKYTLLTVAVIWSIYLVQLLLAGSFQNNAAYPVAIEIIKSNSLVAFLLHSNHGHIASNTVFLFLGGSVVEPYLNRIEYVVAILLGGWITTIVPSLINVGGVGLSGVTNQLLTFAIAFAYYSGKNVGEEKRPIYEFVIFAAFSLILVFSNIFAPEGASVMSHVVGIVFGLSWFLLSGWKGTLSLNEISADSHDV